MPTTTASAASDASLTPLASSSGDTMTASAVSASSLSSDGSCLPRLRSTMKIETSDATIVTRIVDAMP